MLIYRIRSLEKHSPLISGKQPVPKVVVTKVWRFKVVDTKKYVAAIVLHKNIHVNSEQCNIFHFYRSIITQKMFVGDLLKIFFAPKYLLFNVNIKNYLASKYNFMY